MSHRMELEVCVEQLSKSERFWTQTALAEALVDSKGFASTYKKYLTIIKNSPYNNKLGQKVLTMDQLEVLVEASYLSPRKTLDSSKKAILKIIDFILDTNNLISSQALVDQMFRENCDHLHSARCNLVNYYSDKHERLVFASRLTRALEEGTICLDNIAWTEECWLRDTLQARAIDSIYFLENFWLIRGNDEDYVQTEQQYRNNRSQRVFVFCMVHPRVGVIGPYFIPDIVESDGSSSFNYPVYRSYLKQAVETLKEKLGPDFQTCWLQQEGAPSESLRSDLQFLNSFFNRRVISKSGDFKWPTMGSDMSPFGYAFWPAVHLLARTKAKHSLDKLKLYTQIVAKYYSTPRIKGCLEHLLIKLECVIKSGGSMINIGEELEKRPIYPRLNPNIYEDLFKGGLFYQSGNGAETEYDKVTEFEFEEVLPFLL